MPQERLSSPSFSDLGLVEPVLKALNDVGYESPSPIQAETIPHVLSGVDVVGQAQTGTGKTAAFALPLISRVNLQQRAPQVLVLAPTRELAIQISEAFERYARYFPQFLVLPIYGGQSYDTQLKQLRRGVHVVVGTPGRVMDHIRRGSLKLEGLRSVVLDEADEMLRMGFIEDVEWILEQTPSNRQVALFSATMPPVIRRIAEKHLNTPEEVKIKVKTSTASTITQRHWIVNGISKIDALSRILETEVFDAVIIFVKTKSATIELAEQLQQRGFAATALNGDIPQKQRERTVNQLKQSKLDILVATDVVARGLDVDRVSHVINYDIPQDIEAYVHRIGRTGRAGRRGEAILFALPREKRLLKSIERSTKQTISSLKLPSVTDVNKARVNKLKQRIQSALENKGKALDAFYSIIDEYQGESELEVRDIAAALAVMLQGDRPLFMEEPPIQQQIPRAQNQGGERRGNNNTKVFDVNRLSQGFTPYRANVGHQQGVKPSNLVGAIANEAGLKSNQIGQIHIFDNFSVVELKTNLGESTISSLNSIQVCRRQLQLSKINEKEIVNAQRHSSKRRRHDAPPSHNSSGSRRRRAAMS